MLLQKQHKRRTASQPLFQQKYFFRRKPKDLFFFFNSMRFPRGYFRFFKKYFKKYFKKNRMRVYISVHLNYTVSRKSKNSRMGRGVGKPYRRVLSISKYTPALVIRNISPRRINAILLFTRKRLSYLTWFLLAHDLHK